MAPFRSDTLKPATIGTQSYPICHPITVPDECTDSIYFAALPLYALCSAMGMPYCRMSKVSF